MEKVILKILEKWGESNGQFDGMWYGYEMLQDELEEFGHTITLSQIRKEIKKLAELGTIELRPLYDDDWKLCGRGWFLTDRHINSTL